MIITYPISDNFGNEYLIRIEDCQNLPDEIMKELGNIKILDITLERISGEQYTNSGILSKISTFIAGVLLDNENAMLYFYMEITPQKFRSDLFSAMFIRYVKAKSLKDIVDTTITAYADRDIYIHIIARRRHKKQVDAIRSSIENLSHK